MKVCNLIAFAGGVLVGGAAVWLMTSEKGKEFRKGLKEKFKEAKEGAMLQTGKCGQEYAEAGTENGN